MPVQGQRDLSAGIGSLWAPFQELGATVLDSVERVADFQVDLLQSYTHFAVGQWRDALEVHDAASLQHYLMRQNQRAREFGQRVSADTEQLMRSGTRLGERLVDAEQAAMQRTADKVKAVARGRAEPPAAARHRPESKQAESKQAESKQAESKQAESKQAESKQAESKQAEALPVKGYDELTAEEIQQRLAGLRPDDIRRLWAYERGHKNRKTLNDAFARRL